MTENFFFLWIPWIQYHPFLFQSQWSLRPNPQTREDKAIRGRAPRAVYVYVYHSEFLPPLRSTWNHNSFRAWETWAPCIPILRDSTPVKDLSQTQKLRHKRDVGQMGRLHWLAHTQLILPLATLISGYLNFKFNSPISSAAYCLQPHLLFVLPCSQHFCSIS